MPDQVLFVRMKEYNPRAGMTVKRYDYRDPQTGKFYSFVSPKVWAKVPVRIGDALRTVNVNPYRSSPSVFDVCTEEEACDLDLKRKHEIEQAQAVDNPTIATAVDMTGRGDLKLEDVNIAMRKARQEALERAEAASIEKPSLATEEDLPSMAWTKSGILMYAENRGLDVHEGMTKREILSLIVDSKH